MTSKHKIYGGKEINNLSIKHQETYRSNFFTEKIKHCFEAKLYEGCKGPHIGFSPCNDKREFLSYWKYGQTSYFLELIGSEHKTEISNEFYVGNTVMVCLDTETTTFKYVINGKETNFSYLYIKNSPTWYAIIDADSLCTSTRLNVEVNFGKRSFVNQIPLGYLPLIDIFYNQSLSKCRRSIGRINNRTPSLIYYLTLLFVS